ncbi:MAG: hypothetical protein ACT4QD_05800 [Acidobacteriota bacterium]
MTRTRVIHGALVTLGLAAAMHLDWHAARPLEYHLSLGWRWHWWLAVPTCALTAWYVLRAWPDRPARVSVTMLGVASLLAAVVEPAWEYFVDGASLEWTFGRARVGAFAAFLAAGAVTHVGLVALGRLRRVRS